MVIITILTQQLCQKISKGTDLSFIHQVPGYGRTSYLDKKQDQV